MKVNKKIQELEEKIDRVSLQRVNHLFECVTTDGNKLPQSTNLYQLMSAEVAQQLFVNKLYLHKTRLRTQRIFLTRYQFDLLLITFKCTIDSSRS